MNSAAFQIVRIVAVLALVCFAAALATPKGRLPLALRGVAKLLDAVPSPPRRQTLSGDPCCHAGRRGGDDTVVSPRKRFLALLLVLLAILLALI